DRCTIEAHFDISRYNLRPFFEENDIDYDENDCILRRELTAAGKSRSFINDTPVQLSLMRELGDKLVDIHSQHQNLLLNKEDFQLSVVDVMAENTQLLVDYQTCFKEYQNAKQHFEQLKEEIEKGRENEELLRFQQQELNNAALIDGEQEELEQTSRMMTHAEEIKKRLFFAEDVLNGEHNLINDLKQVSKNLAEIIEPYPEISPAIKRLDSCYIELKDIAEDIADKAESIDFDGERLRLTDDRLSTIYGLQQKYHAASVRELIDIKESLEEQLNHIDHSDETLREAEQQMLSLHEQCKQKGDALSTSRKKAARKIEEEMGKRLIPLGIPNVRFQITLEEKQLSANGIDKVAFMFSANKNAPLQPVSQVASGGEIARVMLSLKAMISGAVKLPTIIFDEIDTGVSGAIAEKMARIMQEMGMNDRQVISITHLPQIAAMGTTHYKVFKEDTKDETISNMLQLSAEERVSEIAQMLSGSDITQEAINNARSLLKQASSTQ
ncbi:MAG: DNA repair protein RecN, partial [Prevotella sp.]|nr:DNA repair protein RecN [Prevotella sp.]